MHHELTATPIDLANATPGQRREALLSALHESAAAIARAAQILGQMEQSGDDLSGISGSILRMLRRIRANLMLPEVFTSLGGRLRQQVARLPLQDQREIVAGKNVKLVVLRGEQTEILEADPRALTPTQVSQVFADGSIRSENEQRVWLEDYRLASGLARKPDDEITIDKKRQGILVKGKFITRGELLSLLSKLG